MEIPATETTMEVFAMEAAKEKIVVEKTVWNEINAKQFGEKKSVQLIIAVQ